MAITTRIREKTVPALYLDLDGTVRLGFDELGKFVNGPEDVQVFNEVPGLLAQYKALGWRILACSNQGGIAKGLMTKEACSLAMKETQRQCHNLFDRITWCPHHPSAEDPQMSVCWCRKPKPGLVIESAVSLAIQTGEVYPPHMGLFVGDRPEDLACAANASLRFMSAVEWRRGDHIGSLPKV